MSQGSVTAQTFVEIEGFFALFFSSFCEREVEENVGNGIRRYPVSLSRHVCHGRNNSVSPTGTSNTTPQEMVYRECVCMGDNMGRGKRGRVVRKVRHNSHLSHGEIVLVTNDDDILGYKE